MPHVANPSRLLEAELKARSRDLARVELRVACDGASHHVRFDGRAFFAPDHDEAGEAALRALGGAEPACIRLVAAAAAATTAQWWGTLDPRAPATSAGDPVLRVLPELVRRSFFALALHTEFAAAAAPVRDAASRLALAVLGDGPLAVDSLRPRYQRTREFPSWNPGAGPWSDRELVLLNRCLRSGRGEVQPHLVLLPSEPLARQAVAKYVISLLDHERFLTAADLRVALSPTHRNVKALSALLVAEGVLVERARQYRVRAPGQRRRARSGR